MPERCVSNIVSQGDGFGQVFIERQRAGNGAGNLGDFNRVREAGTEQVAFVIDENLGLVFQPTEGRCVRRVRNRSPS